MRLSAGSAGTGPGEDGGTKTKTKTRQANVWRCSESRECGRTMMDAEMSRVALARTSPAEVDRMEFLTIDTIWAGGQEAFA